MRFQLYRYNVASIICFTFMIFCCRFGSNNAACSNTTATTSTEGSRYWSLGGNLTNNYFSFSCDKRKPSKLLKYGKYSKGGAILDIPNT